VPSNAATSAKLLALPGVSGVGVEKDENGDFVLAVQRQLRRTRREPTRA